MASERGGMMDDLISRSAFIKALKKEEDECEDCMIMPSWHSALKILDEQPTVDAVPVEEIKNLKNPYSEFIECYKCEFDGFETARRHLILKYEEKVQE